MTIRIGFEKPCFARKEMYFLRHFVFTSCSLDVKAQLTSFVTFLFSSNKNYLIEKNHCLNNIFSDSWAITFLLVIKLKLVQITDKSKDWCQHLIMRLKFVQTIQVRKGSLIDPYFIVQEVVIEISLFIVLHDSATKMTLKCFRRDHYACLLAHD